MTCFFIKSMRLIKKISIAVFVLSFIFLGASLVFNSSITGYTILSDDFNYQMPDYTFLIAIIGITIGLLGTYFGGTISQICL